ncbi:MAG: HAMP domain-containing histidine kinase, partial [Hyphomicrobiales bacterium]|nr:HAMP domain-containing histidine kinase [Hyphomicrobiales bacterium]
MSSKAERPKADLAAAPSLRARLLLMAALTIAAALALAWASYTAEFRRAAAANVGFGLQSQWNELAADLETASDGKPLLRAPMSDPRYDNPYSGLYWRIDSGGATALRSRSLWDADIGPLSAPDAATAEMPARADGPDGARLYALRREVTLTVAGKPRAYALTVATDGHEQLALRETLSRDAARVLAIVGVALFAGAALQAWVLSRPLANLRHKLTLVRDSRSARLEGKFPAEVAPLVDDLNALLDAQDAQIARSRAQAGDLAHGLKTPLTVLDGEARRLEAAGDRLSAERLREQLAAMQGHVARELARARMRGAAPTGGGAAEAAIAVDRLLGLFARLPRGAEIAWRNDLPADLRLRFDADDFGEVIGNLLDNARKHARTAVVVSATLADGGAWIHVDDDGPGIPDGRREDMKG